MQCDLNIQYDIIYLYICVNRGTRENARKYEQNIQMKDMEIMGKNLKIPFPT